MKSIEKEKLSKPTTRIPRLFDTHTSSLRDSRFIGHTRTNELASARDLQKSHLLIEESKQVQSARQDISWRNAPSWGQKTMDKEKLAKFPSRKEMAMSNLSLSQDSRQKNPTFRKKAPEAIKPVPRRSVEDLAQRPEEGKNDSDVLTPRRPSGVVLSGFKNSRLTSHFASPRHRQLESCSSLIQTIQEPGNPRPQASQGQQSSASGKDQPSTRGIEETTRRVASPTKETRRILTGKEMVSQCAELLADFEREEIVNYNKIYFIGTQASKLCRMGSILFDDSRGDYVFSKGEHIKYRYEVISLLGKGSFGQVLKCKDHCTNEIVAVKLIRNKEKFRKQAAIEVDVLQMLQRDPRSVQSNVVQIGESFLFRDHVCVVFPLYSMNLYELIKANHYRGLGVEFVRRIAWQLIKALTLLEEKRVIHADLKPENVLLVHEPKVENFGSQSTTHQPPSLETTTRLFHEDLEQEKKSEASCTAELRLNGKLVKSDVVMIDFGSSCLVGKQIFSYIQSRFYRAPEVILGLPYSLEIDMWSLGCVLAELYVGFPLFPGENEGDQLAYIVEALGIPPHKMLEQAKRRDLFFAGDGHSGYSLKKFKSSKRAKKGPKQRSLEKALGSSDSDFVDFVRQCLHLDPATRLRPRQAQDHPFLRNFNK